MTWRDGLRPLLLAAALTSCSAESASPSPAASGSESLRPHAPVEILFRFERSEEQLDPLLPRLTLYADGRLLHWDPVHDELTVRTLTEAGIEGFIAEVFASGSFTESHAVLAEPGPGWEEPDPTEPYIFELGIGYDRFVLSPPDGPTIEVTTPTSIDPARFASSPERDALVALADRLITADWLTDESWVFATPTRYSADAYLLLTGSVVFAPEMLVCGGETGEGGSDGCARDVDSVAWPVSLPPEGIGTPFISADGAADIVDHCVVIGRAVAQALAEAMVPGLTGGLAGHLYLATRIAWLEQNSFYELRLRPLLPEETATCAGKSLFPVQGPQI